MSYPSSILTVPSSIRVGSQANTISRCAGHWIDQLGLALQPENSPVEVLVIGHVEHVTGSEETGTVRPTHGYAVPPTQNASISSFPFQAITIKANKTGEPAGGFTPDRFMVTNVPLHALIAMGYGAGGSEILGGPDWVRSENYDIKWKLNTPVIDELSKLGPDQRALEQKRILQALLADLCYAKTPSALYLMQML